MISEVFLFHILMLDLAVTVIGLIVLRKVLLKMAKDVDVAKFWALTFRREWCGTKLDTINQASHRMSESARTSSCGTDQDQDA